MSNCDMRFWRNRYVQLLLFITLAGYLLYTNGIIPTFELEEDSLRLSWAAETEGAQVEALEEDKVDSLVGMKDDYICKIPSIDPFDPDIIPLISHPRSTTCNKVQPDLVYLDADGILRLNNTARKQYELKKGTTIFCHYKYFDRGTTDKEIVYEDAMRLISAVKMKKNFVKVSCWEGDKAATEGAKIFTNAFAFPVSSSNSPRKSLTVDGDDMNVLILCLESASSSVTYRHLPKTMGYLNETGGLFFHSFAQIGENSLPNMAAMFTGRRAKKEQSNMPAELPDTKDGFYDSWQMIWTQFLNEGGYETAYVEDYTHMSTFHYNKLGFKRPPVDYWYFPYWEQMRRLSDPVTKSSQFCYGNEPSYEIFGQILFRHLDKAQKNRLFMFAKYNHLSHDFTSDIERSDNTWLQLLTRLDKEDMLRRTVLIVMGDHGPRYTDTRRTVAGFAEERLPLLMIRLPRMLYDKYPRLLDTMTTNQYRLTTAFDIHETLLDILKKKYDGTSKSRGRFGQSLFGPISESRTCAQAGIPDRYCLCDGYEAKSNDDPAAWKAAQLVNDEVNRRVKKHKECAQTKVHEVKYYIKFPWQKQDESKWKTYFVAFVTEPLNGIFEGMVRKNMKTGEVTYKNGTLERINPFGPEICVPNWNAWKFCACKKQIKKL